jgi:hypothetical protein
LYIYIQKRARVAEKLFRESEHKQIESFIRGMDIFLVIFYINQSLELVMDDKNLQQAVKESKQSLFSSN